MIYGGDAVLWWCLLLFALMGVTLSSTWATKIACGMCLALLVFVRYSRYIV